MSDGFERCDREAVFAEYPLLREAFEQLKGVHFKCVQDEVGPSISVRKAFEQIGGLFQWPKDKIEISPHENPLLFKQWLFKAFEGVEFGQGCAFWFGVNRLERVKTPPWIYVEFEGGEGGIERLFPLWFEMAANAVMAYSPVDYCVIATFLKEYGWEMYRQP
jgi:hypothetical protein